MSVTEVEDACKPLDNPRQERFAILVASGQMPDYEAYMAAYGCSRDTAEDIAYRLRADVGICRRVDWIKTQAAQSGIADREEVLRWLTSVMRTPVIGLSDSSPLIQEAEDDPETGRRRRKMVPKLPAVDLLAKVQGWLDGDREQSVTLIQVNVGVDA